MNRDEVIKNLKEELIDRYNSRWDDTTVDNTGTVLACKENFKNTLETLIKICKNEVQS